MFGVARSNPEMRKRKKPLCEVARLWGFTVQDNSFFVHLSMAHRSKLILMGTKTEENTITNFLCVF